MPWLSPVNKPPIMSTFLAAHSNLVQGCVLSSGWEGDPYAEFSAMLSWRCKGGSGFVPVLSRHRAVPLTGILASGTAGTEGSEIQGQILLCGD